jgi:hypothetical protein
MTYNESQRKLNNKKRAAERDLEIPPVQSPQRRLNCEADAETFLLTYFPHKFYLPFTQNQREIIKELVHRIRHGGDKGIADSRGSGKTSLIEGIAGFYGPLTGYLRFPVILSATGSDAENILSNIKNEYESNDLLAEDYPEICVPIRDLKGAPQGANSQTVRGVRTHLKWSGALIQFPKVFLEWCPKCYKPAKPLKNGGFRCFQCKISYERHLSKSAGVALTARGVEGSIRGLRRGVNRPDFVLLDDVETEEVAGSLHQIGKLERKIENAIGGLAGPDTRLARVFLCTIQNQDCLAARYTNPQIKPGFSGVRYRQVLRWPDEKAKWDRYIELRQDGKRGTEDLDGRQATAFYLEHREEMDAGAVVANPNRFISQPGEDGKPLEYSAIQHVHNAAADKGWDFIFCEYQNDPPEAIDMSGMPKFESLVNRVNNHQAFHVPADVTLINSFIDTGGEVLWWMVCGWTSRFGGYVLGYGAFPDQRREYFTSNEISPTLEDWFLKTQSKPSSVDESLYSGLESLTDRLFGLKFSGDSGVNHDLSRVGIDMGWKSEIVYRFCRQNSRGQLVLPMKGEGITTKQCPMLQRALKQGERRGKGFPWRFVYPQGKQQKLLEVDVNFAKEFVHDRLAMPLGGEAPITFYGDSKMKHQMLASHLLAERRTLAESNGRKKLEYERKVGEDNHWLDCLVGCAALAAFDGISIGGEVVEPKKKKISLSEIQGRKSRR